MPIEHEMMKSGLSQEGIKGLAKPGSLVPKDLPKVRASLTGKVALLTFFFTPPPPTPIKVLNAHPIL